MVSNIASVLNELIDEYLFQSAISRYLGSDVQAKTACIGGESRFQSAISRYLGSDVFNLLEYGAAIIGFNPLYRGTWVLTSSVSGSGWGTTSAFQSAISRYLGSDPTRKTPPLTSGGGNGLHTPRRIDHIPTFASLNSDKNTRSTHYTPNAGIELSEITPPPLRVNPVQKWA